MVVLIKVNLNNYNKCTFGYQAIVRYVTELCSTVVFQTNQAQIDEGRECDEDIRGVGGEDGGPTDSSLLDHTGMAISQQVNIPFLSLPHYNEPATISHDFHLLFPLKNCTLIPICNL